MKLGQKSSLIPGNRPNENHPLAQSNEYQNIYFQFKNKAKQNKTKQNKTKQNKTNKQTNKQTKKRRRQKANETKEGKISVENLRGYDDIVCEFTLCSFDLLD